MEPLLFLHLDLNDLCVPVDSSLVKDDGLKNLLVPHPYHAGFLVPSDTVSFCKSYRNIFQQSNICSEIVFPRVQRAVEYIKEESSGFPRIIVLTTKPPKTSATIPATFPYLYFLRKWVSTAFKADLMFDHIPIKASFFHYTSWFKTVKAKLPKLLCNHSKFYWVTGGQLPSINFALFLNLLPLDMQFAILGYDPIHNDCFPPKLTSDLYQSRLAREANSLSQKCEYTAILGFGVSEEIKRIARIGAALQTLEWNEASAQKPFIHGMIDALNQPFDIDDEYGEEDEEGDESNFDFPDEEGIEATALLNKILKQIDSLNPPNGFDEQARPHKLHTIYLSAKVKYFKQQNYADFLMRIFTMTEVLLLPELAPLIDNGRLENTQLNDLVPDKKKSKIIISSILEDVSWQKFIQEFIPYPYDWNIGSKSKPSFFLHRAIWECFFKKAPDFRKGRTLFLKDILAYIDALRETRNKVAHNLEGTGRNQILESLIDIDGDPTEESRLFTSINRTEYSLKYDEYEAWLEKQENNPEENDPKPETEWTKDEKNELRKAHEANFFTLCDKYFGIHQDDIPYDQNFGFFDTHINALIKYYLGITDNP